MKKVNKKLESYTPLQQSIYEFNSKLWATWYGKIGLIIIWTPLLLLSFIMMQFCLIALYFFPHFFIGLQVFRIINGVPEELARGDGWPLEYYKTYSYWINFFSDVYILRNVLFILFLLFLYDNKEKVKEIFSTCVLFIQSLAHDTKKEKALDIILSSMLISICEMKYKKKGALDRTIKVFSCAFIYLFLGRLIPLPSDPMFVSTILDNFQQLLLKYFGK